MSRRGHLDVELGAVIGRVPSDIETIRRQTALAAQDIMNGRANKWPFIIL